MSHSIVVHLKDGRAIDISAFSPEEAIRHLRALGVTVDDIAQTVHVIRRENVDAPTRARVEH